jgi:ABC-2 type transport system ATP-binding protein
MTAGASAVEFERLVKRFGAGAPAIAGLSATISYGQVTGLVGPDGAGKTTLMRLMAGLMLPSGGRIDVCGFDTRTAAASIHRVVGYMPQRFGLYEDLTVAENLDLYADLRDVVGQGRQRAFDQLLGFTGLAPFRARLAGRLSGGMKQKLGLACALVGTPKLLLLDEPSVGVDPISRRELWRMIYQLIAQGIAVIWSTSYLDEAERCAAVLLLSEGRLLYAGAPGDLTRTMAKRSYLVRGLGNERRRLLTDALRVPEITDGVIQGSAVRLVVAEGAVPPALALMGYPRARLESTPPRFEDAVVARLGGARKEESRLKTKTAVPPTNGAVVEAQNLTKRFGAFTAVNHIAFTIHQGEIFGLLGANGAGKSTTFKMLCGLLKPSAGIARVAGHDLYREAAAARSRLGYMAQKFSLYGDLSVAQNLAFFAGAYGLRSGDRRAAIERVVAVFDLKPYLGTNAALLPLGYKQRLALACAVMHEPAVLFLDEPTSGIDPLTRREFWAHINAMVGRGVTVLVTTHFMDEAEYCDRIALIDAGNVIAQGSPDELKALAATEDCAEPTLEDAFIALVARQRGRPRDDRAAA